MDKQELKDKFHALYKYMSDSKDVENMKLFGKVMCEMMNKMIDEEPNAAVDFVEKLEAMKWYNYLTKTEAANIIAHMKPSAAWDYNGFANILSAIDGVVEKEPEYNKYALWTVMNMIYSDSGRTLAKLMGYEPASPSDTKLAKVIYSLSIDKLSDEDGVFDVRKYFGLD